MSQNDFTIANQGFPAFRADLNSALQALASNNSGTTEPSTTFANMWWYDSTNNIMYIRNENNDAWIKFAELDQTNDKFVLSGTLQLDDGTASAPALTFNSDTNMGIYRGGTDILKFVTAGTDRLEIDAVGDVGFYDSTGTTAKMTWLSSSEIFNLTDGAELRVRETDSSNDAVRIASDVNEGFVQLYEDGVQTVQIRGTGGSFFNGGNVGIGTNSPDEKLDTPNIIIGGSNIAGNYRANALLVDNASGTSRLFSTGSNTSTAGQFVFQGASSDGSVNVERMKIDSTGHVTMPYQSAFMVNKVGDEQTNVPVATLTVVTFGTEVFDQNNDFSSNTFTAPVTGKYELNCGLYLNQVDSASTYYYVQIVTSNRTYQNLFDPDFGQDAAFWTFNIPVLADMDAGDTAQIKFFQHTGTAQTDINGSAGSYFSGYLVA